MRGAPRLDIVGRARGNGLSAVRLFSFCLCLIIAGCGEPAQTVIDLGGVLDQTSATLTNDEAIAIARRAIKVTKLQKGAPVTVERKRGACVVTFVHVWPPGTRGGGYDAEVTIDARTKTATRIMSSD